MDAEPSLKKQKRVAGQLRVLNEQFAGYVTDVLPHTWQRL